MPNTERHKEGRIHGEVHCHDTTMMTVVMNSLGLFLLLRNFDQKEGKKKNGGEKEL